MSCYNQDGFSILPYGGIGQFNLTDLHLMCLIQNALLEPEDLGQTWPSEMWTKAEVVNYINDRQRRFLMETGINQTICLIEGVPRKRRYSLPEDAIDVRRLAWREGTLGTEYLETTRIDGWQADQSLTDWPTGTDTVPDSYIEGSHHPSLTAEVVPAPTDAGEIELTYTALGAAADGDTLGGGVILSVPDEFAVYLKWGVIADLLGKEGEASDPDRAAYAEQRFQEGIELARILLAGNAA